jgi:hypothetical protein
MDDYKPFRGLVWTARIWGGMIVAFILYIVIQEYIEELVNPKLNALQALVKLLSDARPMMLVWILCFLGLAGLVLAYWKPAIGGGSALLSFIVMFLVLESGRLHAFSITALLIIAVPCILYLVYWQLMARAKKEADPPG